VPRRIDTALPGAKRFLIIALPLAAIIVFFVKADVSSLTARLFRPAPADRMAQAPKVILWAWERPEDLSFINTAETGVAFLAKTIYLQGDDVIIRPRLQPLTTASGTRLIGVVRIEARRATLSADQQARAAAAIARVADEREVFALQIDFDARDSERRFYRALIEDLRGRMPESARLSITALASWCMGDNWLEGLPIDEAVPMLFRMGADHANVAHFLKAGGDFRATASRHSLGISTDEPLERLPSGRRVYIFNPKPWTEATARKAIEEVKERQ
jgi:hypothetical protein